MPYDIMTDIIQRMETELGRSPTPEEVLRLQDMQAEINSLYAQIIQRQNEIGGEMPRQPTPEAVPTFDDGTRPSQPDYSGGVTVSNQGSIDPRTSHVTDSSRYVVNGVDPVNRTVTINTDWCTAPSGSSGTQVQYQEGALHPTDAIPNSYSIRPSAGVEDLVNSNIRARLSRQEDMIEELMVQIKDLTATVQYLTDTLCDKGIIGE